MKQIKNELGYVQGEVFKIEKFGNSFKMVDTKGNKVGTNGATIGLRKGAYKDEKAVQAFIMKTGKKIFRKVDMSVFNSLVIPTSTERGETQKEEVDSHQQVLDFIHNGAVSLKPRELVMEDLSWKYLVRSAVRAKNIMMTGPSGCGKTMAAKALVTALERPDFYFNLGATQDPRATLIGNTQFDSKEGTFFAESAFVTAIKTENAVILLDELSRAHPDAWNILMTVLDQGQRYLRLDEKEGAPIVNVAKGVTFIATANIGSEYTSTRIMDRAIMDRFVTIDMKVLNQTEEFDLLKYMFPDVNVTDLDAISQIASYTRIQSMNEDGKLSSMISTRASVEMASLIYDGFNLHEAAEISVYPFFSPDGGVDSERTHVRQFVQKFKVDDGEDLIPEVEPEVTDEYEDEVPMF